MAKTSNHNSQDFGLKAQRTDPVCGMKVDPLSAADSHAHAGLTYYFCSGHCLAQFKANPTKYAVKPAVPVRVKTDNGNQYTCPMHPEIVRDAPGSCPKCGMALMPVAGAEEDRTELRDMTRRFVTSVAFSVPLVVVAMLAPELGGHIYTPVIQYYGRIAQFILATPVVLWCGWPFFRKFWRSLMNRSPNMYTLIGLGVGLAYLFSVAGVLAPELFSQQFRERSGEVGVYFEAAAVIVTLVLLGEVMQLRAMGATSRAIRRLLSLAPNTALRIEADGREVDVPLSEVQVGDKLRVRPGEKVP
jgi:Cu+-exporting ATPase